MDAPSKYMVAVYELINQLGSKLPNRFTISGSLYPVWISTTKVLTYTGGGLNYYNIDTTGYKYISIVSNHCPGYSSLYNHDLLQIQCNGSTVYSTENTNNHKSYNGAGNGNQYFLIVSCSNQYGYCSDKNHTVKVTLSN